MTFKLLSSSDKSWLANKSLLPLASRSTFFTLEQLSIWCDLRSTNRVEFGGAGRMSSYSSVKLEFQVNNKYNL